MEFPRFQFQLLTLSKSLHLFVPCFSSFFRTRLSVVGLKQGGVSVLRVPNWTGVPEWPCPEGTPSRSLATQLWRDSCTLHTETAVQARARNTRVSCGREFNTPLDCHSATGVGGQDAQAPGPLTRQRGRCRHLPHLPRAPRVGDGVSELNFYSNHSFHF